MAKTLPAMLGVVSNILKPSIWAPELPATAEFTSGESMGHPADRLAPVFGVIRKESDKYTARSHQLAAGATNLKEGLLKEIDPPPPKVPGVAELVTTDNGISASTMEALSKLIPAFVKPYGIVIAVNASYLTDDASASLIMSVDAAVAMGYKL